MKSLVLEQYNRLVLKDTPIPAYGAGEVLVGVRACGICGSDVHGVDGSTGRRLPPIVMGHEAAGVVAEVGEGVTGWSVGERVTFDSTVYCGRCRFCRAGRVNLCEDRRVLGVSCEDYRCDGAFAEYVAVPERILYRLPDGLSFEQAAMIEALSIAVHAVNRAGQVGPTTTALVVGAGVIGNLVIQVLKARGCGRVIAADIQPGRIEMALEAGADEALDARAADVAGELMRLTGERGADVSFEVVGTAATLDAAMKAAGKGAVVVLVGNFSPTVEFPLVWAVTRELDIRGSCASSGEYPECLELISTGRVDVDCLTSAVAPLEEGPEWFARLAAGEGGLFKVVLVP